MVTPTHIFAEVDAAAEALGEQLIELVPTIAERSGVTEADVLHHLKRSMGEMIKRLRLHDGVDLDDGRAARWRVRLQVWGGPDHDTLLGDSDPGLHRDAEGETVIKSLPSVGEWVRELVEGLHPDTTIEGLSAGDLSRKVKSLRVTLHHQNGACAWRLRYTVKYPTVEALTLEEARARGLNPLKFAKASTPRDEECLAQVRISRESAAPRVLRK